MVDKMRKKEIYLVEYGSEYHEPYDRYIFVDLEKAKEKCIEIGIAYFKDDIIYVDDSHLFNNELFKLSKIYSGEYISIYKLLFN